MLLADDSSLVVRILRITTAVTRRRPRTVDFVTDPIRRSGSPLCSPRLPGTNYWYRTSDDVGSSVGCAVSAGDLPLQEAFVNISRHTAKDASSTRYDPSHPRTA
jgi:hypothetical protein